MNLLPAEIEGHTLIISQLLYDRIIRPNGMTSTRKREETETRQRHAQDEFLQLGLTYFFADLFPRPRPFHHLLRINARIIRPLLKFITK